MPAMKLTAERSSERVTLLRAFRYGIDLKGRATKQHEGAHPSPLQRALSAHACDVAANAEFQLVILFTAPSEVQFPASASQARLTRANRPVAFLRRRPSTVCRVLWIAAAAALAPSAAAADQLVLAVTDARDCALIGASVVARNTTSGVEYKKKSDGGTFALDVPAGPYVVPAQIFVGAAPVLPNAIAALRKDPAR